VVVGEVVLVVAVEYRVVVRVLDSLVVVVVAVKYNVVV